MTVIFHLGASSCQNPLFLRSCIKVHLTEEKCTQVQPTKIWRRIRAPQAPGFHGNRSLIPRLDVAAANIEHRTSESEVRGQMSEIRDVGRFAFAQGYSATVSKIPA